ncbi:fused (3R)-hydroxyacyl-ACP dehydratase subunits HadA/HadB [Nocardia sp. AG03]|uniref:fused (3R)-hydroxyacyl-ACP dehydratase subunits HadA/HadB n=1 Tax=Nocardia sp. AG03 TaxID=3025312 RepID=UPI0024182068|nr:fused (3R)-hydroxyacyl-ACP dehydratase subunits HadA/HadB [Nocardia sp. AG03]
MSREQTVSQPDIEAVVPDTTLVGQRFGFRDHYEVGREKIREFARAVQNLHPAHQHEVDARKLGYDGVIAPPTFASVIGMSATRALLDSVLTEYDISRVLQTDQVFEIFRPILAGDRISTEIDIESIRQFGDNDFIVVGFKLVNQHDQITVQGTTTIVARKGVEVDPNIVEAVENISMHPRPAVIAGVDTADVLFRHTGPVRPGGVRETAPVNTTPEFDSLVKGAELPTATARVTRGDLANYAGVSGDPNPIHFSDRAAELAGLPTVVAHGLLTMGLTAQYLTDWLGDPTAIEKLSVRFSGFVPVPPTEAGLIEFSGKIKSIDPERRAATVLLSGISDGRKLFGRAAAEIRLT